METEAGSHSTSVHKTAAQIPPDVMLKCSSVNWATTSIQLKSNGRLSPSKTLRPKPHRPGNSASNSGIMGCAPSQEYNLWMLNNMPGLMSTFMASLLRRPHIFIGRNCGRWDANHQCPNVRYGSSPTRNELSGFTWWLRRSNTSQHAFNISHLPIDWWGRRPCC